MMCNFDLIGKITKFVPFLKSTFDFRFQAFYYIFHVKIIRAHKRKFDSKGQEIEPNFSETKKVNTGYLNTYSKC